MSQKAEQIAGTLCNKRLVLPERFDNIVKKLDSHLADTAKSLATIMAFESQDDTILASVQQDIQYIKQIARQAYEQLKLRGE